MKLGFRVLLQGAPGDGKSTALNTLSEQCGLDTYVAMLEPGEHVLRPHPKMHYSYISTYKMSWAKMRERAVKIRSLSNEMLQKTDGDKQSFPQFYELMELMNNFIDQKGVSHGDVDAWGHDKVIVVDCLTGLSKITKTLAVGDKPALTQPDYQVVMNTIQNTLDKYTLDCTCHVVVLAHLESERDGVTGAIKRMPSTVGKQLAPLIPGNFSESVLAYREGSKFLWSTLNDKYILKHFYLPMSNTIHPSFKPIYEGWKKRQEEDNTK